MNMKNNILTLFLLLSTAYSFSQISFSSKQDPLCFNSSNGSITVNSSTPISGLITIYQLNNGSFTQINVIPGNGLTTQTISGLSSGTYKVADSITAVYVTLNNPTPIEIVSINIQHPSGSPLNNGSIQVIATGGTGPLNYFWNNGSTSSTINGLVPGQYRLTVSDIHSCSLKDTMYISAPPVLSGNWSLYQDSCMGGKNILMIDSITPTNHYWHEYASVYEKVLQIKYPNGNIQKYPLNIMATNSVHQNIPFDFGGVYSAQIVITDPAMNSIISSSPWQFFSFKGLFPKITLSSDSICNNSTVTITANNVMNPQWYWPDGSNSNENNWFTKNINNPFISVNTWDSIEVHFSLSGECPVITDSIKIPIYLITSGSGLSILPNIQVLPENPCPGDPISIYVENIISDSIVWTGNSFIPTNHQGNYFYSSQSPDTSSITVEIQVINTCSVFSTASVIIPFTGNTIDPALTGYSVTPTTACLNDPIFSEFYGDKYYDHSWNYNDGTTSTNAQDYHTFTTPGSRNITLTIQNNCGANYQKNIPVHVVLSSGNLKASDMQFKATSTNACVNDYVMFTAHNLAHEYIINYGDGTQHGKSNVSQAEVTFNHTYTSPGTYTVVLKSITSCNDTLVSQLIINISSSGLIPESSSYENSIVWMLNNTEFKPNPAPVCANTQLISNVPGTEYNWYFNYQNPFFSDSVTGLLTPSLPYAFWQDTSVEVTLQVTNGCGISNTFTKWIALSGTCSDISSNIHLMNAPTCSGGKATVVAKAFGGSAPYFYVWNDPNQTVNDTVQLSPGYYFVTITDNIGKQIIDTVVIPNPNQLQITTSTTQAICGTTTGSASVIVQGGVSPYHYVWSNGTDSTSQIQNIASGIYAVSVTDQQGCEKFALATVIDQQAPNISVVSVKNPSCFNGTNGEIDLDLSQNSGALSVFWSNGKTTSDIKNLEAGTYFVQVTNSNGCKNTQFFSLTNPNPLAVLTDSIIQPTICGANNGKIYTHATGGNAPYTYLWSSGTSGQVLHNATVGEHQITVTDSKACTFTQTIYFDEFPVSVTKTKEIPSDCNTENGTIQAKAFSLDNTNFSFDSVYWAWNNLADIPQHKKFMNPDLEDTLQNIKQGKITLAMYATNLNNVSVCAAQRTLVLASAKPSPMEVCLVSATDNNENIVFWEPATPGFAKSYQIYREDFNSSNYIKIGETDSINTEYLDKTANAAIKSYKYKITMQDACGRESDYSTAHRTPHLNTFMSDTGMVYMKFEPYAGFVYDTLRIMADTVGTDSTWFIVKTIPGAWGTTSYAFWPDSVGLKNAYETGTLRLVCDYPKTAACGVLKTKGKNSGRSNSDFCCPSEFIGFTAFADVIDATAYSICNGQAHLNVYGGEEPYTYVWSDGLTDTQALRTDLCAQVYGVTVYDNIGTSLNLTVHINAPLWVKQTNTTSPISIYPNPVKEMVWIKQTSEQPIQGTLQFYHVSGRLLLNMPAISWDEYNILSINTSQLMSGMYYIKYISAEGIEHSLPFVKL